MDYLDIPKFHRRQEEYYKKIILFCSRLDDDSVVDAIESIRDIFNDMPEFLRRLENYIYLKFNYISEVNEMIPWNTVSVIMEVHNSEKFAEKTINSLISQTMDDFELILVNGFDDDLKFENMKLALENEDWVKFIEDDEDIVTLRNKAFNEAKGDYVFFCDDSYIFENSLFEEMLETSLMNGSEISICNTCSGGEHRNSEIKISSIMGNKNYLFEYSTWEKIMPHIFSSNFEPGSALYKKSLLNNLSITEEILSDKSVLQIKAILNSSKITYVNKFLFKYLTKGNIYYDSKLPRNVENALEVFELCDDVERFLKEKSVYDDLKTYFDIYKINQISSFLDYVQYVGSYSYNDPKNRDLYANNDKVLDYSQYYGSKSEHVGLNYAFAEEYFTRTKEEFDRLDYRDLRFLDLNANRFSNNDNLNRYNSVLKSGNYKEYMDMANFKNVEELRERNIELKKKVADLKSKKENLSDEASKIIAENENEENKLKEEISRLTEENKELTDENNRLREEYWENREEYDYILASKSWQYTKWMRRE